MAHSNFAQFEKIVNRKRMDVDQLPDSERNRIYRSRKWNQLKRMAIRDQEHFELEMKAAMGIKE